MLRHSDRCRCGHCELLGQPNLLADYFINDVGRFQAVALEYRGGCWKVQFNMFPHDPEHRIQNGLMDIVSWNTKVFREDKSNEGTDSHLHSRSGATSFPFTKVVTSKYLDK